MTLPPAAARARSLVLDLAARLDWLPPTVARVGVGLLFLRTGLGKLTHLEGTTEFFASLGIPAPGANALLASATEVGCGALLLVGLCTRLAALPLSFTMLVALLTAKRSEIEGLQSLFGLSEALYIVIFLFLFARGAGPLSLDRWLARRLGLEAARP